MLLLLAAQPIAAPQQVRISRANADPNFLFPATAKKLTRFMMQATYGEARPLSAAWAQRAVLDAAADSDFHGRLTYYDQARQQNRPRGAILVAERDDGAMMGFADVGASLWLPNDRAFRLPQSPDLQRLADTGIGPDGQRKAGVELRPYVSNLVVDPSVRRGGIGRRLMQACEAEALGWLEACRVGDSAPCDGIWLEVTASNAGAMRFYDALGYEGEGTTTTGNEVQCEGAGSSFAMVAVERRVLRKSLRAAVRLRGGLSAGSAYSPPAQPHSRTRRRLAAAAGAAAAAAAVAATSPRAGYAFPPPVGDPALLVPLLHARALVAERTEAVRAAATGASAAPFDWGALQRVLNEPPITEPLSARQARQARQAGPGATAVGSAVRAAAERYDASLRYTAEIDDDDRRFCYVSKAVKVDEQCLQRLYTSDRTYRALLRNAVLQTLQDLEDEAGYRARCARAK